MWFLWKQKIWKKYIGYILLQKQIFISKFKNFNLHKLVYFYSPVNDKNISLVYVLII